MENKYTFTTKDTLIEDIKQLQGYEGYIQFSDTKIRDCDIFQKSELIATKIEPTNGFIYEAHFYSDNEKKSIQIKQINDSWLVSTTDISKVDQNDTQEYISDIENFPKVKMAQIWEEKEDELCDGMKVKRLKKVVFAGFLKGESK